MSKGLVVGIGIIFFAIVMVVSGYLNSVGFFDRKVEEVIFEKGVINAEVNELAEMQESEIGNDIIDFKKNKLVKQEVVRKGYFFNDYKLSDGSYRREYSLTPVNTKYEGEFIDVDYYYNFYSKSDRMVIEKIDGTSCEVMLKYDKKDIQSKEVTIETYDIKNVENKYYFTTNVSEDVDTMAYEFTCDIEMKDNKLKLMDDLIMDFTMTDKVQGIEVKQVENSNEITFESKDKIDKTDLKYIDPELVYDYDGDEGTLRAFYDDDSDDAPPPDNNLPPSGWLFTEMTSESALDSSDDTIFCFGGLVSGDSCVSDTNDDYPGALFNITLDILKSNINRFNWTIEIVDCSSHLFYLYDYQTTSWDFITGGSGDGNKFIGSTDMDYVSSNSDITLLVMQNTGSGDCGIDYGNIAVDFNVNLDINFTNPTSVNVLNVTNSTNVTLSFVIADEDSGDPINDSVDINNVSIGGTSVNILNKSSVLNTVKFRIDDDGATDGINNPTTVSFTALDNASYSVMANALDDTDVVYSFEWSSKGTTSFDVRAEDDTGIEEVADFMYGAIPFGEYDAGNDRYIKCGQEGSGSSGSVTFSSGFPNIDYSAILLPSSDEDSPRVKISENIRPKDTTGFDYAVDDDNGNIESVSNVDWCAFSHGEYDVGDVVLKAGTATQVSLNLSVSFNTAMSDTDYSVFITNVENTAEDACACEVYSRSTSGWWGTCADDSGNQANCNSEDYDWVVIENGDTDAEVIEYTTQIDYNGTTWLINITTPDKPDGLYAIFLDINYLGANFTETEFNAVLYGEEAEDSCTYSGSGDWVVNLGDNCRITDTDVDVDGKLKLIGTGGFRCDQPGRISVTGGVDLVPNGTLIAYEESCVDILS